VEKFLQKYMISDKINVLEAGILLLVYGEAMKFVHRVSNDAAPPISSI
jgi:hypothetical protein